MKAVNARSTLALATLIGLAAGLSGGALSATGLNNSAIANTGSVAIYSSVEHEQLRNQILSAEPKKVDSTQKSTGLDQQTRDAIYARWWVKYQALEDAKPTTHPIGNRTCVLLCGGR